MDRWRAHAAPAPVMVLALVAGLLAQDPPRGDPVQGQAQHLVDEFHRVMPRDPTALRQEKVRRETATAAIPVLRQMRAFAAQHPESLFAGRALEFAVLGLVLGDEPLTATMREQDKAGDATARLLLASSAVIVAADAKQRATAIDAVATTLRERERPPTPEALHGSSFCLSIAAALTGPEATTLATNTVDTATAKRFAGIAQAAARDARRLLGQPFELAGRTVAGTAFSTRSLHGKVVLVDFWATWCQPCVRALPTLVEAKRKYGVRGLEVVGVSCDQEAGKLTKFLADNPAVDWTQLFEPGTSGFHPLAVDLGVTAIPRLFLIDRKGVLRSVDAHDRLDELLAQLLAE